MPKCDEIPCFSNWVGHKIGHNFRRLRTLTWRDGWVVTILGLVFKGGPAQKQDYRVRRNVENLLNGCQP